MKKLIFIIATVLSFNVISGDFVSIGTVDNLLIIKIKLSDVHNDEEKLIEEVKRMMVSYLIPIDHQTCYAVNDGDGIRITYPNFFISPVYDDLFRKKTIQDIKEKLIRTLFGEDV